VAVYTTVTFAFAILFDAFARLSFFIVTINATFTQTITGLFIRFDGYATVTFAFAILFDAFACLYFFVITPFDATFARAITPLFDIFSIF
jgi:hypothetical protein